MGITRITYVVIALANPTFAPFAPFARNRWRMVMPARSDQINWCHLRRELLPEVDHQRPIPGARSDVSATPQRSELFSYTLCGIQAP